MAKQSAADKLIARIDADIAAVEAVANYVGSDGSEALTARIEADLARFTGMRGYVTGAVTGAAVKEAVKRTRGPNKAKKGLTEYAGKGTRSTDAPDQADEATRMSV
jgi:hypothetical protein